VGWQESPARLLQRIEADRAYFEATSGGVTLSGGEPLMQSAAAAELLGRCRTAGLHTVVETCGAVGWSSVVAVLPQVSLFFFDLKAGSDALHRELTGAPLGPIVDNARRLLDAGGQIAFRMPIVPGLNDAEGNLEDVCRLLCGLGQREIRLLQYHAGGEAKLSRLDSGQAQLGPRPAPRSALLQAASIIERLGLSALHDESDQAETDPAAGPEPELFSPRVLRLRAAVQNAKPGVCAERALRVTEYFKRRANRRKPVIVQKAEALREVLGNRGR